jgi:hypothetical protein
MRIVHFNFNLENTVDIYLQNVRIEYSKKDDYATINQYKNFPVKEKSNNFFLIIARK